MTPALVVIDVQRAFDDLAWGSRNNPAAEARVAEALSAWRAAGAPVIHVRHVSEDPDGLFVRGTEAFAYKPEAEPLPGEPEIAKHVNSAFIGTDLEARLRALGGGVAFAGLTTDHCCSTTARMAGNLGFDTWVLGDAMATFDRTGPDGATFPADLVHRSAMASLHGEFADVIDTATAIDRLRTA